MALQEMLCAFDYLLLFAIVNGFRAATKTGVFSVADFNEYQLIIVLHNQVKFSHLAAIVPFNELHAVICQER